MLLKGELPRFPSHRVDLCDLLLSLRHYSPRSGGGPLNIAWRTLCILWCKAASLLGLVGSRQKNGATARNPAEGRRGLERRRRFRTAFAVMLRFCPAEGLQSRSGLRACSSSSVLALDFGRDLSMTRTNHRRGRVKHCRDPCRSKPWSPATRTALLCAWPRRKRGWPLSRCAAIARRSAGR